MKKIFNFRHRLVACCPRHFSCSNICCSFSVTISRSQQHKNVPIFPPPSSSLFFSSNLSMKFSFSPPQSVERNFPHFLCCCHPRSRRRDDFFVHPPPPHTPARHQVMDKSFRRRIKKARKCLSTWRIRNSHDDWR